jgi:hypothetical protein
MIEPLVQSPRRTVVRCASGGRALASDPPGKATSICAAIRDVPCDTPTPLYAFSRVSGPRRLLLRARPARATGREAPAFAGALRTSTEPATISPCAARFRVFQARRRTTQSDFMTSDVGRGLRDESKDSCPPTPQGSGATRVPLLAEAPSTLCHRPGCMCGWSRHPCLGKKPGPTEILVRAAPREGGSVPEDQGAWNRSVGRGPVKGRPFEPVDRPPLDAAPRGALPKWRASAGSAFSSRLTLNAWSGD